MIDLCKKSTSSGVLQIIFSFTYAMVLAPWRNPIYFIVWLVLLEFAYLILFDLNVIVQLGVISAYLLGWVIGRQLFECYANDPFIPHIRPWDDDYVIDTQQDCMKQVINLFYPILGVEKIQ